MNTEKTASDEARGTLVAITTVGFLIALTVGGFSGSFGKFMGTWAACILAGVLVASIELHHLRRNGRP